jgi:hypothetical protein
MADAAVRRRRDRGLVFVRARRCVDELVLSASTWSCVSACPAAAPRGVPKNVMYVARVMYAAVMPAPIEADDEEDRVAVVVARCR